jgi:hypothetical protein
MSGRTLGLEPLLWIHTGTVIYGIARRTTSIMAPNSAISMEASETCIVAAALDLERKKTSLLIKAKIIRPLNA